MTVSANPHANGGLLRDLSAKQIQTAWQKIQAYAATTNNNN